MKRIVGLLLLLVVLAACTRNVSEERSLESFSEEDLETAVFAGGCFWCMESAFEQRPGVVESVSGYTGGHTEYPTYEEVTAGDTGHYEAVEVYYLPDEITYEELLDIFWLQIDPTDDGGQFSDRGPQYRTAIFYRTEQEKHKALDSKEEVADMYDQPIATQILEADIFYGAEEYHQDYYKKQQANYKVYEKLSGRKDFVEENKERFSEEQDDLRERLTPIQYRVTQEDGTEPAFNNKYWDFYEEGIYVDIVSGEPLFSSTDKYKSGTGWPSFTKPLEPDNIIEKTDRKLGFARTEIRSKEADSHLGHVFKDGPKPSGLRYCMNSAALRFIPKENLTEEGYGEYMYLFE